jgi:L-lactate dehydrogenase (cytochrome)
MEIKYNSNYPSIDDLRKKAQRKIPRFAFEYLDGGCNEDVNLHKNTGEIRQIELKPYYLKNYTTADLRTEIFGNVYDAPFGIAPVGLQGLMWPNAPEILAKAAFDHNIPFILSTVTTSSIERISEITEGKAWFQLYHPAEEQIRDSVLNRVAAADYPVLVVLSDVPTFGYRPRDIRNGLAMPPKMTLKNILQIIGRPEWALKTLFHGQPAFETMKPYMPKGMNMRQLGLFMNKTFSGRLNEERVKPIRDKWKGKLVLKGVASEEDTEMAIRLGFDGIIVSNHGGRQLDAGQSAIRSLLPIVKNYKDKIAITMDSGIRSGPDIARTLACGADFTFWEDHSCMVLQPWVTKEGTTRSSILKTQLRQVLEQLCCSFVKDLPKHLI